MFSDVLKQNNILQKDIAIVTGISQQAISKWCRGNCEPSLNAIIKMSDAFNIPIEQIVLAFKKGDKDGEIQES